MAATTDIADLLEKVSAVAVDGIVQSKVISRAEREALERVGWLRRIIRGWYLLLQPTDDTGVTTAWYASFWAFASQYLASRLGDGYCLSAESSLDLQLAPTTIPHQAVVISARGGSSVVELPGQTSLLTYQQDDALPDHNHVQVVRGVRAMTLPLALARVSPAFFEHQPELAELALRMIGEPSLLVRTLVDGRYVAASERIAGALEFLGDHRASERIKTGMAATGYKIRPENPLHREHPVFAVGTRIRSPYAGRVSAHWTNMRESVLTHFDVSPTVVESADAVLQRVEATHVEDAYHSLSIEGYQVTPELIQRVREGEWDPSSPAGQQQRDAFAAKGYSETFELVAGSIRAILEGSPPGAHVTDSIQDWYAALFSASVSAGLISASDLAGYRNGPVTIRGARHVPPRWEAVPDAMEAFTDCMRNEPSAVVRAILGHFLFVWIHPYSDGNGRLARFIMNTMLVTGGLPWTIIRVDHRAQYMRTLELASCGADIVPFVEFVAEEARRSQLPETTQS